MSIFLMEQEQYKHYEWKFTQVLRSSARSFRYLSHVLGLHAGDLELRRPWGLSVQTPSVQEAREQIYSALACN